MSRCGFGTCDGSGWSRIVFGQQPSDTGLIELNQFPEAQELAGIRPCRCNRERFPRKTVGGKEYVYCRGLYYGHWEHDWFHEQRREIEIPKERALELRRDFFLTEGAKPSSAAQMNQITSDLIGAITRAQEKKNA